MTPLELLQADQLTLTQILLARRTVTVETVSIGMRILFNIYLTILEDAITTLNSLIAFLEDKEKPA